MKRKINHIKIKKNDKFYTWAGYFDENDNYCELYGKEILANRLDEAAIKELSVGHDITIALAPKLELVAFAKYKHDIDRFREEVGDDHVKLLLETFSKYNDPDFEKLRLWTCYDFS